MSSKPDRPGSPGHHEKHPFVHCHATRYESLKSPGKAQSPDHSRQLGNAFFTPRAFVNALIRSKQSGAAVLVSSVAARIGIANHEVIGAL
jgi:hypothetical protein